jgi:hypothetical protein
MGCEVLGRIINYWKINEVLLLHPQVVDKY